MKFYLCLFLALLVSCNKTEFKENKIPVSMPMAAQQPIAEAGGSVSASDELPPGHPPIETKNKAPEVAAPSTPLPKAAGGHSIEEVFNGKGKLAGKKVSVRGKVVKFSGGIMNKNWIHIKDGSGADGKNDLTVTTTETAKLNDIVVVTGTAQYDKDVGAGYFYPAIIEDAKLQIEK